MRRAAVPLLALVAVVAATALPALAANQTVVARYSLFNPGTVAVRPGDTLTIHNGDGVKAHSLQFTDEAQPRRTAEVGWTETRVFTAAEARDEPYTFFCSLHAGMSGRVYVNATGTAPPSPTPTTSPSPPPTASPPPGGSPAPLPQPSPAPAPAATVRKLALRHAGRHGVALRIDLSQPADVRGTLRRGKHRFRVRFGIVADGPQTLRIKRHLAPGRYRLKLTAAGTTRTLRFRVS